MQSKNKSFCFFSRLATKAEGLPVFCRTFCALLCLFPSLSPFLLIKSSKIFVNLNEKC